MSNSEFLKWTTSDVDFYSLLGLTLENVSASELRRAYRKTALKYHPDKVGKDFDPDKYELFQAANEVLSDPELKGKYDAHRNAKLQKQRANELLDGKRRQMKEDLEARERNAGGGVLSVKRKFEEDDDMKKMAELGRQKRAEILRNSMLVVPEHESPSASRTLSVEPEDDVARLERKIQEAQMAKAKRKADKQARKSGNFDSPASVPAKFSFSPSVSTPKRGDFAATMERLRNAEKERQKV